MIVGILRLTLHLPSPGSLKSKRHLVRSAIDRVKAKFNVSIAEVADNDLWQKATLGIAAVANEHAFAQESVSKVVKFIEDMYVAPITALTTEVVPLGGELYGPDEQAAWAEEMGAPRTLAEAEAAAAAEVEEEGGPAPRSSRKGPAPSKGSAEYARFSDAYAASKGRPAAGRPRKAMSQSERERAIADLKQRLRDSRRGPEDAEE